MNRTRPIGEYGGPDSGPKVIRVRGVASTPSDVNVRLRWAGGAYAATAEVIVFYEPTSITPKTLAVGAEAWVIWRPSANRYEELSSTAAPEQIVWAELTEDKAYADVAKLAKPVLANGTLDSGADDFYLIDQEGRYWGLAAFDDTANGGGVQKGYRFHGVRISDDWASSGKPGFRIIDGEDPDDIILVTIDSLTTGSEYACTYSGELPGGPDSARRPRYTQASTGLPVFDDFALVPAFTTGDPWIAKWVKEDAHYAFWRPLKVEDKVLWTLDPAGGHTLATISATTLQLNLKIRKLKLRIFEVREDVADDVEILYEDGVECPTE